MDPNQAKHSSSDEAVCSDRILLKELACAFTGRQAAGQGCQSLPAKEAARADGKGLLGLEEAC